MTRPPTVPLPPQRMPLLRRGRPLKRWRYVGAFCEEVMLCVGEVRVGPARQSFWAVWDRRAGVLRERTRTGGLGGLELAPGRVRLGDADVELWLDLDEGDGVETVCPHGRGYVWTRKQAGVGARGELRLGGAAPLAVRACAVVDDTAGYHARATEWRWTAGVGRSPDGRALAWNLVEGVNDPPSGSERAVWVDGRPSEVAPVRFAPDLSRVVSADGGRELRFIAEAERRRRDNLVLVRSEYRQPFGTFSGMLPDGSELEHGLGVIEYHRARW